MTGPVRDTAAMIAQMAPALVGGTVRFLTVADGRAAPPGTLATIREAEGLSAIVPCAPGTPGAMRQITLTVTSALDGVGLTAAVATALAEAGIACNMVAGHHHDHVFVPEADAERALDVLRARAAREGR